MPPAKPPAKGKAAAGKKLPFPGAMPPKAAKGSPPQAPAQEKNAAAAAKTAAKVPAKGARKPPAGKGK